jgi:hypothetical protein
LTEEPDRGASLTKRDESVELAREGSTTDMAVPARAGAVVVEFISSIVQEAQARAQQGVEAAEEEVAGAKRAATEQANRIRERLDALAGELSTLRQDVRREADSLANDLRAFGIGGAARAELMSGTEEEALATVARSLGEESPLSAHRPGVEIERIVDAEVEPDPDDHRAEVAGMSDLDLARAYARALKNSTPELADIAVEEALERPAFSDAEADEPRPHRFRRRKRRRAAALGQLREACRSVRQQRRRDEITGRAV